ncbi:hypothetical protein MMC12_006751, partial [Toensbergia leucococca]|nr:hypothetical protein [Toensbergia leucococca]
RDIAVVHALLLSSGVKANEICRRAQEIRDPPSQMMLDLQHMVKSPLPPIPRCEEHAFAARRLIKNIELSNRQLDDAAEHLANSTVPSLRRKIQAVDEHISLKLTPLVRAAADDADAFSTEITTTCTLAAKQLNDSIDLILRRRRRRLRWARRGGYVVLEWMLLGIMWWVWMIVVVVRLARGIVKGVVVGVRWVFWL